VPPLSAHLGVRPTWAWQSTAPNGHTTPSCSYDDTWRNGVEALSAERSPPHASSSRGHVPRVNVPGVITLTRVARYGCLILIGLTAGTLAWSPIVSGLAGCAVSFTILLLDDA
jgi:hypothetical protein